MRALDRKALRDLWHMRGQVVAIGLVIASGVAVLVMSLSTLEALHETSRAYYERYRFGDVFATLKRAPEHLAGRIAAVPGVKTVQTRIVQYVTLDVEGFAEPVIGQIVSMPEEGQPRLNRVLLRSGRTVAPGRLEEVVLNEPFAQAHGLTPGSRLHAVLNGNRRELTVVGVALAPEFIYSLGPGALVPDDRRFGVLWMGREALAAAFDLQGAFNNVSLELARGAQPAGVIRRLDTLLEPYGGVGAIARADQLSNWFVMNEIDQLATMSIIMPSIFLTVAAILTNMVLARLIAMERGQIGLMKAFGYSQREVGLHYAKMVLGIAAFGILIGLVAGSYFGRLNTQLYAESFRFPLLLYRPSPAAFFIAAGVSLLAALGGAVGSVRRAAALPPAQAMMPPAPPDYRESFVTRTRGWRWLDQPTRIVLRNIARWPGRAALTAFGLAAAVGLMVLALQWSDSIDYLAQRAFFDAQRQHVTVGLAEPQAVSVVRDFEHMQGVLATEPMRAVGADFSVGPIVHRGSLTGVVADAALQPIFDDASGTTVNAPANGIVIATRLGQKLGVRVGDSVWVEILEGRRAVVSLPVVGVFETHLGMPAYMHIESLNRLMKERPSAQLISLLVDGREEASLYRELKNLPSVSAVMIRRAAIDAFYSTIAEHLMVFISIFSLFACALGFGVAYNSTRIALSERGRELATMRVLGFTRGEVSYILLGEIGLLVAIAMPLGCYFGLSLTRVMAAAFDTELFRLPLHIEPSTFGWAVVIALAAIALSAAIVRRRIDRLHLVEVLKTRE